MGVLRSEICLFFLFFPLSMRCFCVYTIQRLMVGGDLFPGVGSVLSGAYSTLSLNTHANTLVCTYTESRIQYMNWVIPYLSSHPWHTKAI